MHITIVGAGFCGLATVWHLLTQQSSLAPLKIRLIDSKGIGGGASGVAAGLLHPYVGAHAKLNWMGQEGFQETCNLLQVASKALGRPVYTHGKGILRLALTTQQKEDYKQCVDTNTPDVEWLTSEQCQTFVPGITEAPGLWIKNGLAVHSSLYLQGLWKACKELGAQFEQKNIHTLKDVDNTDLLILTTGAATRTITDLSNPPLRTIKGQVLELAWPTQIPPLPCALNSQAYILMSENQQTCLVGATYERNYMDEKVQPELAIADIMPKACAILPFLQDLPIVNCYAGARAMTPQRQPLIHAISPTQWLLTGMGSKGLLYHALMAKELIKRIQATV